MDADQAQASHHIFKATGWCNEYVIEAKVARDAGINTYDAVLGLKKNMRKTFSENTFLELGMDRYHRAKRESGNGGHVAAT